MAEVVLACVALLVAFASLFYTRTQARRCERAADRTEAAHRRMEELRADRG